MSMMILARDIDVAQTSRYRCLSKLMIEKKRGASQDWLPDDLLKSVINHQYNSHA